MRFKLFGHVNILDRFYPALVILNLPERKQLPNRCHCKCKPSAKKQSTQVGLGHDFVLFCPLHSCS